MNKLRLLFIIIGLFVFQIPLMALSNYAQIYPPIPQRLETTTSFSGDRHGDFNGDYVAHLTDGSAWKVHPKSLETYRNWHYGDLLHISVRTDWYWFKREHKFLLNNDNTGESIKVMMVQRPYYPSQIVGVDSYYKSYKPSYSTHSIKNENGTTAYSYTTFNGYIGQDPRKVLLLSDGTYWVIKDNFEAFTLGMTVYVGAQGEAGKFYDFVFISGTEREAQWTFARPQSV